LLENVVGKSGRPIIKQQTVLTEKHINILQKFLIDEIHVSNQLDDGSRFIAQRQENHSQNNQSPTFQQLQQSVNLYKDQFINWRKTQTIDVAQVRHTFLQLFEKTKQLDINQLIDFREILLKQTFYSQQIFKSVLAVILAKIINCDSAELNQIGLASLLSDAGMIKYDESFYEHPNELFDHNLEQLKHHPVYSYRLVEDSPFMTKAAKLGILQHHERIDGTGYPLQLNDQDIHRIAKIIGLSDEFTRVLSFYLVNNKAPVKQTIIYFKNKNLNKFDRKLMSHLITQLIKNS